MAKLFVAANVNTYKKFGFSKSYKRYSDKSYEDPKAIQHFKNMYNAQEYLISNLPFYSDGMRDYDCKFHPNKWIVSEHSAREKGGHTVINLYKDESGYTYKRPIGLFENWTSDNILKLTIDGKVYVIKKAITVIDLPLGYHTVSFYCDFKYEGVSYKTRIKYEKTININLNTKNNYLSIMFELKDGFDRCYLSGIGATGPRIYNGYYDDEYRVLEKLQSVSINVDEVDLFEFNKRHINVYYTYEVKLPKEFEQSFLTYSNGYYSGRLSNGVFEGEGLYCWNDGDKYVGNFKNGLFHGKGTYTYANGNRYEGEWFNDKEHGQGTLYYTDGTYKQGLWENGEFISGIDTTKTTKETPKTIETKVEEIKVEEKKEEPVYVIAKPEYKKETYENGHYEGYFLNGQKHGQGTYFYNSGVVLKGTWKNGKKEGEFTYTSKELHDLLIVFKNNIKVSEKGIIYEYKFDNGRYVGTSCNGVMHGRGTYYWDDLTTYEGDWVFGKRTGNGTISWPNKNKYVGKFVDGNLEGEGIYYFNSGNRYEGEFKNNAFHGKGVFYYKDGNILKGTWENDKYIEPKPWNGKKTYDDGYYEGNFLGEYKHGLGTYYYNNGSKYVGNYAYDKEDGEGIYYGNNGIVSSFVFKNGKQIESKLLYVEKSFGDGKYIGDYDYNGKPNGNGKITYSNGDFFEGKFIEGKACGYGVMNYNDSTSVAGIWEDNQLVEIKHSNAKHIEYVLRGVKITKKLPLKEKKKDPYTDLLKDFEYEVKGIDVIILNCKNCSKTITIPEGVTIIGANAFAETQDKELITSVKISSSVRKIEQYAFMMCSNLVSLQLGANVEIIETGAFYGTNLCGLDVPRTFKLKEIKGKAFVSENTTQIAYAMLPNNIKVASDSFSSNWRVMKM